MLKSVEGTYQNGQISLSETPAEIESARVVVTFLPKDGPIDLQKLGISEVEAGILRAKFTAIADDWNRPEMDVYNDM